jgi:hypothetical protein
MLQRNRLPRSARNDVASMVVIARNGVTKQSYWTVTIGEIGKVSTTFTESSDAVEVFQL